MCMKNILFYLLCLILITACVQEDFCSDQEHANGLLNLSLTKVGETQVYSPKSSGPYKNGDVIEFDISYREGTVLDLSRMKLNISLENNCYAEPKVPGFVDLSVPYILSIINSIGDRLTFTIKVNPIMIPKAIASVEKEWFLNANQLQCSLSFVNYLTSIAISQNTFVVYDGVGSSGGFIKAYNTETGELLETVSVPNTFISQVKTDDAGHIIANRMNIYGAGFMLYYYDDIHSTPQLILNYTAADGCPKNLGGRISVVGNLKEGKAYVYATTGRYFDVVDDAGANAYYYWEFNDGIPTNIKPIKVEFPLVNGMWQIANVQRETVDAESDIFLSHFTFSETDSEPFIFGSNFYKIKAGNISDIIEMQKDNFEYKILSYETFEIENSRFLVMLLKGFTYDAGVYLKVFDITDEQNFVEMKPGTENYDRFVLYSSESYLTYHKNHWGDIAVDIKGKDAYIYAIIPDWSSASAAGVMKYHLKYEK